MQECDRSPIDPLPQDYLPGLSGPRRVKAFASYVRYRRAAWTASSGCRATRERIEKGHGRLPITAGEWPVTAPGEACTICFSRRNTEPMLARSFLGSDRPGTL